MEISQDVISSYRAILRRKNVNALALESDMMGEYATRATAIREENSMAGKCALPIRVERLAAP